MGATKSENNNAHHGSKQGSNMARTEPYNEEAVPHTERPQEGSRCRTRWSEFKKKDQMV